MAVLLLLVSFYLRESFVIRLRTKPGSSPVRAQEHFSAGEDLKTDAIDIESGTAAFSGTTVRVAFCDVAGGDGESLEWQGLQRVSRHCNASMLPFALAPISVQAIVYRLHPFHSRSF